MTSNIVPLTAHPAITVNQKIASQLVGADASTVRRMVKEGRLHPQVVGGRKFYDLDELNDVFRPRNKFNRNTYLLMTVDDYDQLVKDVASELRKELNTDDKRQ
ncbi:MerR family transcriptional regulator [Pediococcus pentosaceus]|uniref:DNA-binding protein n=1 Tax=Pediococcus pentosaceus TaxID=1255 RepID=UPI003982C3C2